jgi:hypothetical protein
MRIQAHHVASHVIVLGPSPAPDLGPDRPVVMSSLAGALASPDIPFDKIKFNQDVDMHPSSFDDAPPDTATDHHLKQEEEMGDLFGEDSNVDFVQHGRLVFRPAKVPALASLHALFQTK